ncbi:MAG: Flp pilus assembly complex ATPase component TadA [Arcobacteraceae bacterium]|nr:Flp pilus assembly complex ATPase component TadA [Arcobacteraceae bacterium]
MENEILKKTDKTYEEKHFLIGELLKEYGYITQEQIDIALKVQKINNTYLGEVLLSLNFTTTQEIAMTIAKQSNIEYIDIDKKIITEDVLKIIPHKTAKEKVFLPIEIKDDHLIVATENLNDIVTIDYLNKISKYPIKLVVGEKSKIKRRIDLEYSQLQGTIESQIEHIISDAANSESLDTIKLIDLVIDNAIKDNATDIHITPDIDIFYISFRIDGVLSFYYVLPKTLMYHIISRIKILSSMDISEQRLPQDGSFSHIFNDEKYDFRVSSIPTDNGENIVMRILSSNTSAFNIENLGFNDSDIDKLKKLFNKPYGIVLITGPTGSGKTTTLYSLLRHVNFIQKNILTIEDPIEYRFPFIKQTQINVKSGYTFDKAIRHFMRQDPDVMLVGEIRDKETAQLAVRASITGHLVLSTLHTNDAVGSIPRLIDLGIKEQILSSSVLAVLSQRLLRKLCTSCKKEYKITKKQLLEFGFDDDYLKELSDEISIFKKVGCDTCKNTGYRGREAVIEIFTISDKIKDMINKKKSHFEILKQAKLEDMVTMDYNALLKVLEGKTSLEEVKRVIL